MISTCQILVLMFSLNRNNSMRRFWHCPCSTDEETEKLSGFRGPIVREWQGQDLNLGLSSSQTLIACVLLPSAILFLA